MAYNRMNRLDFIESFDILAASKLQIWLSVKEKIPPQALEIICTAIGALNAKLNRIKTAQSVAAEPPATTLCLVN